MTEDHAVPAVDRALERCRDLPNVTIRHGAVPEQIPEGRFDLIVFSDIGYYFDSEALAALAEELRNRLSGDGIFLAAHWLGTSRDHLLSGDRVHEILGSTRLALTLSERYEGFRLDCWRQP